MKNNNTIVLITLLSLITLFLITCKKTDTAPVDVDEPITISISVDGVVSEEVRVY